MEESFDICGLTTRNFDFSTCYDEIDAIEDQTLIFPQVGHPIGGKRTPKGKGFFLDNQSLKQA